MTSHIVIHDASTADYSVVSIYTVYISVVYNNELLLFSKISSLDQVLRFLCFTNKIMCTFYDHYRIYSCINRPRV